MLEDYEETTFEFAACFTTRHLCRIFDRALLALIGHLAAEEVGKTWLNTHKLWGHSKEQ